MQPVFDLAQLEEILVIRAVCFSRFFFTGCQETRGGFGVNRLASDDGIGHNAHDADRSEHVQLIGVEQDLGFQGARWFGIVAEAVGADTVLHGSDLLLWPSFGLENPACEIRRGMLVLTTCCASTAWPSVWHESRELI